MLVMFLGWIWVLINSLLFIGIIWKIFLLGWIILLIVVMVILFMILCIGEVMIVCDSWFCIRWSFCVSVVICCNMFEYLFVCFSFVLVINLLYWILVLECVLWVVVILKRVMILWLYIFFIEVSLCWVLCNMVVVLLILLLKLVLWVSNSDCLDWIIVGVCWVIGVGMLKFDWLLILVLRCRWWIFVVMIWFVRLLICVWKWVLCNCVKILLGWIMFFLIIFICVRILFLRFWIIWGWDFDIILFLVWMILLIYVNFVYNRKIRIVVLIN